MNTLTHVVRRSGLGVLALAGAALVACSPALNWREIRVEEAGLSVMLPCKPDRGVRAVALAGQSVDMGMVGCEVGGATYAVAFTRWPAAVSVGEALTQWQAASLANMGAAAAPMDPFVPAGALQVPQSQSTSVQGRSPERGASVHGRLAWFARSTASGTWVFQAAVFAPKVNEEAEDTFLAGVKFQ